MLVNNAGFTLKHFMPVFRLIFELSNPASLAGQTEQPTDAASSPLDTTLIKLIEWKYEFIGALVNLPYFPCFARLFELYWWWT